MKNLFGRFVQSFKNGVGKVVAGGAALVGAGQALAVDHSAAITAAAADGTTSLTTAVTAVIGIVAVVVGAGLVISFLRKS